jgi:hypothetical protein
MRIQFETGGGVAGPAARRVCEVDTDKLPAPEAAQLTALVEAANLPALSRRLQASASAARPDDTYFEITVHDKGQSHNVSGSHRGMPPELRPLVHWLASRAAAAAGR